MPDSSQNFYKKFFGRKGEVNAYKYLKKKGYLILERNFTCFFGEADIIAKKDETLIFVEVKSRYNDNFGRPAEAVGVAKQNKYRKIAEYYLLSKGYDDVAVRFDVIEVLGYLKKMEINHIENAF